MPLKYQNEIDNFNLAISCPLNTSEPDKLTAYRFTFKDIGNELNFVPNVIFDKERGIPYNYAKATEETKCRRCGASFYTNSEKAQNSWSSLSPKIQENLGYTHIAEGILNAGDGIMTSIDNKSHFGFYEDENADLSKKFTIINAL